MAAVTREQVEDALALVHPTSAGNVLIAAARLWLETVTPNYKDAINSVDELRLEDITDEEADRFMAAISREPVITEAMIERAANELDTWFPGDDIDTPPVAAAVLRAALEEQ